MKIRLPSFENARVLVVGDVMLDRYWYGNTKRISPEAPVPVVHINNKDERPGGAGNVALNIAALGSQAALMGVCGDDEAADILEHKLIAANITCCLQRIPGLPTITKLRILSQHQQLIRLDFEEHLQTANQTSLLNQYPDQLQNADVVVLSDYAKGALRQVHELIRTANNASVPVLIDPKSPDFTIYNGATLITPNLKEFEAVVGPCTNEAHLVSKGQALLKHHNIEALLVTRGEHGMTLIRRDTAEFHLPAQEREVYDVTGAGDTVIAMLAASLAAGADMITATQLANIAAGISVSKLGAATVSLPELRRAINISSTQAMQGIMNEDQLLIAIQDARAHQERIVMTGGCFDILHAGHVAYLEEAKALGDRLVVVVNDDDSVRQLKGTSRPINTLSRRMSVLAGLSAVDWIVPFSELTPERIIAKLQPDIWAKGGDYSAEDLPETRTVMSYGGRVEILKCIEGESTSGIVTRLRKEDSVA